MRGTSFFVCVIRSYSCACRVQSTCTLCAPFTILLLENDSFSKLTTKKEKPALVSCMVGNVSENSLYIYTIPKKR